MATKVRQIVPMAGDVVRFSGMVYVTDDAEAGRLGDAGFAEILESGLPDAAPTSAVETIPEGSMAAQEPKPKKLTKKQQEASDAAAAAELAATEADAAAELAAAEAPGAGASNPSDPEGSAAGNGE